MAEGPEPGRRSGAAGRYLPVQEPQCRWIFEVRIEPAFVEQKSAECGCPHGCATFTVLLEYPSREAPVTDRSYHILADAEGGDGIIAQEDVAILADSVKALLQPRVTKREGLVTREGILYDAHPNPPALSK
jgi:hypothetical protein